MDLDLKKTVAGMLAPQPDETIYEWAEREIYFPASYKALESGKYDVSRTPFWRGVMDDIQDRSIHEHWVVKGSQTAASENLHLIPMRWRVCNDPCTQIFVGGEEKSTEEFWRERIKSGLQLGPALREKWKRAEELGLAVYYDDGMIVAGWAKSKGITKTRAVDVVNIDELDVFVDVGPIGKLRRRMITRPFPKLVGISAMDANNKRLSSESPIWIEFLQTCQRYYFLYEPEQRNKKTRRMFKLGMGWKDEKSGKASPWGLKWSEDARDADGNWDAEIVRESTWYQTPGGARVDDALLLELIQDGVWKPTNKKKTDPLKRGYHLSNLYVPWCPLGNIAAEFLEAKKTNPKALRVFIMEVLAEQERIKQETVVDTQLHERQGDYGRGVRITESDGICNEAGESFKKFYIGKKKAVGLACDAQTYHLWWVAREWIEGGDSGLIDFGTCVRWSELNEVSKECAAHWVTVDAADGKRAHEIYNACLKYRFQAIAGQENITHMLYQMSHFDPIAGARGMHLSKKGASKNQIDLLSFRPDPFRSEVVARIGGETDHAWCVYHGIEREYVDQVISTEKKGGVWVTKEGQAQDHLFHCEVHQVVAATKMGLNEFREREVATP